MLLQAFTNILWSNRKLGFILCQGHDFSSPDERKSVRTRTFTRWMNVFLQKVRYDHCGFALSLFCFFLLLTSVQKCNHKLCDLLFPEQSSTCCARPVHRYPGWQDTDGFAGTAVWVQTSKSQVSWWSKAIIRDKVL